MKYNTDRDRLTYFGVHRIPVLDYIVSQDALLVDEAELNFVGKHLTPRTKCVTRKTLHILQLKLFRKKQCVGSNRVSMTRIS